MPRRRGRGGVTLFGLARRAESSNPSVECPMVPPALPGRCERLAGAAASDRRALLRAVGPVAEGLVAAKQQLLDVAQDVQLPGLHLRLENVDHVLREAEAGPELDEDLPDCLGVVGDAQRRFENLLDE